MRGFLTYLTLWIVSKKPMTGAELSRELEKRKGKKPSPGTIYPALKELREKGLLKEDGEKRYSLTKKGEKELEEACQFFCSIFYDMKEMSSCCREKSCD